MNLQSVAQDSEYSDSLFTALQNASSSVEKVRMLISIANNYSDTDPEKALQYAKSALMEAENSELAIGKAEAYLAIGNILESDDQYNLAIDNYVLAYQIYSEEENLEGMADLSYSLADVYKKKGYYQLSLERCLEGLELYESLNDQDGISDIYRVMGSIYKYQSEPIKSLEYYNKALEIRRALQDTSGMALCFNNIGVVYSQEGNQDLALDFYNRALDLFIQTKDDKNQAILFNNISRIMLTNEEYDKAFDFMTKSLEINTRIGYSRGVANQYESLGRYYDLIGKQDLSIENFLKAFDLYKELGRLEYEKNITEQLSESYFKTGDYEKAYYYLNLHKQFSDSIFNLESVKTMATLEFEFRQLNERELHKIRDGRTRTINTAIGITLFLSLIIAVLLYSRQKIKIRQQQLSLKNINLEKRQIETDLELKQKELTVGTIYNVKKNEDISVIIDRLTASLENLKDENVPIIRAIIEDLSNSTNPNIWEEFEIHFLQVHKGFYDNIIQKFPELTTNEKRLSAFLRLDLSTKEISTITNQSPHSINIARTRLRKKLGLANKEENLSTFLSQF